MLQARFAVERLFVVPAGAFRPAPKVESAVVRLVPLGDARPHIADADAFRNPGHVGLRPAAQDAQRNALKRFATDIELEREGIAPGARGETLVGRRLCAAGECAGATR